MAAVTKADRLHCRNEKATRGEVNYIQRDERTASLGHHLFG